MNNKLNYNILIDLSKNLATGLFPYVFANKDTKLLYNSQPLYNNYSYNSNIPNNNLLPPKASVTKKKILYDINTIPNNSFHYLDYNVSSNYNFLAYFKCKERLKISNELKKKQKSKQYKAFLAKKLREKNSFNKEYNKNILVRKSKPIDRGYNVNLARKKGLNSSRSSECFNKHNHNKVAPIRNNNSFYNIYSRSANYGRLNNKYYDV